MLGHKTDHWYNRDITDTSTGKFLQQRTRYSRFSRTRNTCKRNEHTLTRVGILALEKLQDSTNQVESSFGKITHS